MFYVWFWKWLVKYFEEKQKTRKVKLQTITEVPEIVESTLLEGPGTYQGGNCEKPNLQEREKLKKKKDAMKKSRNFLSSEQDILKELGCSTVLSTGYTGNFPWSPEIYFYSIWNFRWSPEK